MSCARDEAPDHLAAYSPRCYQEKASYALFRTAVERFQGRLQWLSLGAGEGATGDASDGLTRFKSAGRRSGGQSTWADTWLAFCRPGGRHDGKALGALGDATVFGLSGTKLVTGGEGGLATFRDREAAERFSYLRAYGFKTDYSSRHIGLNGKLSELNAALGWLSLDLLGEAVTRRQAQVQRYRLALVSCVDLVWQKCCRTAFTDTRTLLWNSPPSNIAVPPRPPSLRPAS